MMYRVHYVEGTIENLLGMRQFRSGEGDKAGNTFDDDTHIV